MTGLRGHTEPRIYTPPLRDLTPETSLGFAACDFAEDVCGISLYPWQKWLLQHALELDVDGRFRFRKVVVLVARQAGKSTLSQVLSLFGLYVLGRQLVLGTAQDLDTAKEVWEGALQIIEDVPELAELADRPILAAGQQAIRLKTGERYKIKAANRRAGRGLSSDLIILDELREHQSWDAWAAITGTTNARDNAQIWALSNAGDASSIVLRHLRKTAHSVLGDPDGICQNDLPTEADGPDESEDSSLGLFEWSAPPGAKASDRGAWAMANPSLGYGSVTERTLLSASRDPEWVFRTECLCQWSDSAADGLFPGGAWESGTDPDSRRADGGEVAAAVEMSHDRTWTHVTIATRRDDGAVHVERVASRAGSDWLVPWFTDPERPHRKSWPVAIQGKGAPASSLIEQLEAVGVEVVRWEGSELATAHGRFYDLVRGLSDDGKNKTCVYHRPDSRVDVAAATAVTKPLGDGWVIDRKRSPSDATPLVGAIAATWLLLRPKEVPQTSAYESAGVASI